MAQIVVIDDDSNITEVIEMYLEGLGHKIASLSTAQAGLDWIKLNAVDLVITDIMMPDMNGLELIQEIHVVKPGTPILAISGGGESGGIVKTMALDQAVELGAKMALEKPFTKEQLVRKMGKLLNL